MKLVKGFVIAGLIIIGVYTSCRITGVYTLYRLPTTSNEPTLKLNSIISVSNLKSYKPGDFIVYNQDTILRTHRLIASGGDKIEIKNGNVFINDKDFDKNLTLMHTYTITEKEYVDLKTKIELTPFQNDYSIGGRYTVFIDDKIAKDNKLTSRRIILEKYKIDPVMQRIFGNSYNKDNLGPLVVPKDKVFVLGDNRDNSEDSRYLGFINQSDIKGVVLQ